MVEQICMSDILTEGSKEIFETMLFMTLEECDEISIDGESILSSIAFTGKIEGYLSVNCSLDTAKKISAEMLFIESVDEVTDEEMADAMGEVANLVVGGVKSRAVDKNDDMIISVPTVINGKALGNKPGEGASKVTYIATANELPVKFTVVYKGNL